ncbi:DUF1707 domain-containing protein [Diaminobutyricibacter tongyongensis]|uniref:DUF1707 domain-containing protein n=1 Tax=Leifsonia tongyongensis TaxID=1268043 RepID=A0A6L9XYT2_9MICO|nr:DUF1707 domain-containing protein [Diaminobutyricibacter tongyongensis]NEN06174.1 DUF1707 domain-containing protein [Diaminobutyricibacter tongyongensis]
MTDFTDPSESRIRLSHAERDQAVAALEAHARDGRLSDSELATRSASARAAVTRGDLAPLFADLPGGLPGSNATATFAPTGEPSRYNDRYSGGSTEGWRLVWTSIIPFIALILFFLTGLLWGFAYSWLWFFLIPVVAIIAYADGGRGRERNRDRYR